MSVTHHLNLFDIIFVFPFFLFNQQSEHLCSIKYILKHTQRYTIYMKSNFQCKQFPLHLFPFFFLLDGIFRDLTISIKPHQKALWMQLLRGKRGKEKNDVIIICNLACLWSSCSQCMTVLPSIYSAMRACIDCVGFEGKTEVERRWTVRAYHYTDFQGHTPQYST